MAVSAKLYGGALKAAFNKEIDWDSDTIKGMLCGSGYVPDQDVHAYKSAVTSEVAGTGYTAGGASLSAPRTVTYIAATNTLALDAPDLTWPNSTITARFLVIYDATPSTDATRPLIAYVDFGVDVSSVAGPFSVAFDPAGIVTVTAA